MYHKEPVYNENGLQYMLAEDGAYILRYEGNAERLVIPDTLGGRPVIGLKKQAFANYEARPNPYIREIDYIRLNQLKLKEIILPETLKRIDEEVFGGLSTLENLIIPESVAEIKGFAFFSCSSLTRIRIPGQIQSIGSYTFYGCRRLEEVILPEGLKYIGKNAFEGCTSLHEIDLPDSVVEIGEDAFYKSGLVRFAFPPEIKAIEHFTLCECKNLEEVILPEQVRTIALRAFGSCTSLKRIRIPASVDNLGNPFVYGIPGSGRKSPNGFEKSVFENCTSLEAIDVDPENQYLSSCDGVLYDKDKSILIYYPRARKDRSYTVPEDVTELMSAAFEGNPYITEVKLPDSLKDIKSGAFSRCENLKKASPPSALTRLGHRAYFLCKNLEEFAIPPALTYMGDDIFTGCDEFEHLELPDSLNTTSIGISGMKKLKTIRVPKGVQYVSDLSRCPVLERIELAEDHPTYEMEDGMLFEKKENGKRKLCRLLPADSREVLRIPEDIRQIASDAFEGCRFREVFFPEKLTYISDAFRNCRNLEEIHFPAALKEIENLAFEGCTAIKKLVLPDGFEQVGNYTFAFCTGLESAELPASLRHFGVSLFSGCTSLTDVYLRGGWRTWCRRTVIRERQMNFPDQAVFRYK